MQLSSISLLLALALQVAAVDAKRPFSIVGTTGDPPAPDFNMDSGLSILHVASASVEEFKTLASDGVFKVSYALAVLLTDDGATLNKKFTDAWIGRHIAVILDDVIVSLPKIMVASEGDFVVSVSGDLSREDVQWLAERLSASHP